MLALCVANVCATSALAASPQPAEMAEEEETLNQHKALLSEPAYSVLQTAWREVQADLEREAWVEATGRLSYLVELRTDLGLPNLAEFASVLIHAAEDAADNGATDAAAALADDDSDGSLAGLVGDAITDMGAEEAASAIVPEMLPDPAPSNGGGITGEAAIPEPTGALLYMLGALLTTRAIRRKR